MYTPENAYAIGPGLHDHEREEWEMQEIARDQQEKAMKKDFYWWEINAYCDRSRESGKKDIDERMNSALDLLFDTEKSAQKFRHGLFLAYCSNDHVEAMREMIRAYLFKSYSIDWKED